MDLNQLPSAVEDFHAAILESKPILIAMIEILREYDVTEGAVRARFEAHFRLTPEQFVKRIRPKRRARPTVIIYKRKKVSASL